VITRTENALREVSLVAVPTWDDAEVLVRSATRLRRPTPRADAARAWLDALQSR
jgi:phage head maturation protease